MRLTGMVERLGRTQAGRRALGLAARASAAVPVLLTVLAVLVLAGELFGCFAAFTWHRFGRDHAIYTNMLWNTAHGAPFRFERVYSYLAVHLSFSLALLAPLFRVWDHPFLLSVVQWAGLAGGAALLGRSARRGRVAPALAAALVLLLVAHPFAQATVLVEFHGAGLYLFTVPWLYVSLCERPASAWLPLLLHLGLREDAFVVILPLLGYFAVRERRPVLWAQFAVALLYGLAALFVIYPAINGVSLFAARSGWMPLASGNVVQRFAVSRLTAIALALLPLLAAVGRGWWIPLLFMSVPLVQSQVSNSAPQQSLSVQYGAAVISTLAAGLTETARRQAAGVGAKPGARRTGPARALLLAAVVVGVHGVRGFLPGGGQHRADYARLHARGLNALQAVAQLPPEGVLLCGERDEAFCGNRGEVTRWNADKGRAQRPDWVLAPLAAFVGRRDDPHPRLLLEGYSVAFLNDAYALLQRGGPPHCNAALERWVDEQSRTVVFINTRRQLGEDVYGEGGRKLRYWRGDGKAAIGMLVFGRALRLPAGAYRAHVRLGARTPRETRQGHWGLLQLCAGDTNGTLLAQQRVDERRSDRYDLVEQVVDFSLEAEGDVEPRVIAGDAPLWLADVWFEAVGNVP